MIFGTFWNSAPHPPIHSWLNPQIQYPRVWRADRVKMCSPSHLITMYEMPTVCLELCGGAGENQSHIPGLRGLLAELEKEQDEPAEQMFCCCCCCCVASVVSDSVRPHRRQPTRLLCPRDSPGKNTGVGCHFLFQCMKVTSQSEVAQSGPTLSDRMDCSLPGSSVHGIFQARVLEWGATAFSQQMS